MDPVALGSQSRSRQTPIALDSHCSDPDRSDPQRCSDPVAPTPSLGPRRSNPFARTQSLGLPSPAHPSLGLPSLGPTSFRTHRSAPTASPPCSLHGRLPLALLGPRRSDPVAWTHGNCSDLVACAFACCRPLRPLLCPLMLPIHLFMHLSLFNTVKSIYTISNTKTQSSTTSLP